MGEGPDPLPLHASRAPGYPRPMGEPDAPIPSFRPRLVTRGAPWRALTAD
jgi:hypothetical protein